MTTTITLATITPPAAIATPYMGRVYSSPAGWRHNDPREFGQLVSETTLSTLAAAQEWLSAQAADIKRVLPAKPLLPWVADSAGDPESWYFDIDSGRYRYTHAMLAHDAGDWRTVAGWVGTHWHRHSRCYFSPAGRSRQARFFHIKTALGNCGPAHAEACQVLGIPDTTVRIGPRQRGGFVAESGPSLCWEVATEDWGAPHGPYDTPEQASEELRRALSVPFMVRLYNPATRYFDII